MEPILIPSTRSLNASVASVVSQGDEPIDPYSFPSTSRDASPPRTPGRDDYDSPRTPSRSHTPAPAHVPPHRWNITASMDPMPEIEKQNGLARCARQLDWEWALGIRTNPNLVNVSVRAEVLAVLTDHLTVEANKIRARRIQFTPPPSTTMPEKLDAAFRRSFACWVDVSTSEIHAVLNWVKSVEAAEREMVVDTHATLDSIEHIIERFLMRANALPRTARASAIAQVHRRRAWIYQKERARFDAQIGALRTAFRYTHSSDIVDRVNTCRDTLQSTIDMHKDNISRAECEALQHAIDEQMLNHVQLLVTRLHNLAL